MIGGDETRREVEAPLDNLPARNRGTNRRSIQHAGKLRSSMYFAAPVTLASPSLRRTFVPTARPTMELSTDYTDYTDWSAAQKDARRSQAPGFAGRWHEHDDRQK